MKKLIPRLAALLTLSAALPVARAADEPKPAAKEDKKDLRVIVNSERDAPHAGVKVVPRVFSYHPVSGEKEIVAFLGVDTAPVSPTLSAQLGLPEGSGLVVNHLM